MTAASPTHSDAAAPTPLPPAVPPAAFPAGRAA